ncbi:Fur family transcriptional regulator [Alkalitalea saponilacus]|uniref:Fur family transcriptional regulator, ferric uptake regulator n=1 Tax=Alkalitalea saponilacus TaxID=889453 RepID=A0A1T5GN31_9BACT|nr:transcriptional repressor [Alkalitalea saponilacus]ASB48255.1 transcriptional repressor [Alkalitalea saponilacus]SKC09826.1 Fur family transcriptional regulator, ferric uptake regulator [Alkalitalea saponilacus]
MNPSEILFSHNLKRTSCREGIIQVIGSNETALSEQEIRQQLEGNYDRTTYFRSFKTLEDSGIIHKIVVDNQTIKYALGAYNKENRKHAHFYCSKCQKVKCMTTVLTPEVPMPEGYRISETNLIIKGTCNNCNC